MNDVITQIHNLIKLSKSSFREESRTSALKAIELIEKYNIEMRLPPAQLAIQNQPPRQAAPTAAPTEERRILLAKYEGRCPACGVFYAIGAPIAWSRGSKPICRACHTGAAPAAAPVAATTKGAEDDFPF